MCVIGVLKGEQRVEDNKTESIKNNDLQFSTFDENHKTDIQEAQSIPSKQNMKAQRNGTIHKAQHNQIS